MRRRRPTTLLALALLALGAAACVPSDEHEPRGTQVWESPQSQPLALSPDGSRLYVANTSAGTVSVFNLPSLIQAGDVRVGNEPVSVAVRPDGLEVWVANHLSDSVSVIDTNPASATYLKVVETVQWLDPTTLVSKFDEPVGIAFASNAKAYVALSSRNQVAVVDATTYSVTGVLQVSGFSQITAQEPRALVVRNGRLYVAAFESGNRSEIAACPFGTYDPEQCTLFIQELIAFATNPNLPGIEKNIITDPDLPDRDVFVFDTSNDQLVTIVSGVGTLLYGLAVDGAGKVFVAQTDARNAVNGLEGATLADLDNRMFLNEVATFTCSGASCSAPSAIPLEPAPPAQPAPGDALAVPYGIQVSGDGAIVVGTASGSRRLFTLNAATGQVLGRVQVGHGPRGVVLVSGPGGAPQTAYVLNTLESTISAVNVSNPAAPVVVATVSSALDPTPAAVRLGRIAFHDAEASSSGTFSCASCHPDGHTDQLLWRIGGACFFGDCSGLDETRSTMPIRGLRGTLPLHWDGTLGDPIGGPNGAISNAGSQPASCDPNNPQTCFRHLVNASLSGVMCEQPSCPTGPSGLPGRLGEEERENMAAFLDAVAYPPARSRRPDDALSASANFGFRDFFVDQQQTANGASANPDTCADSNAGCHALPLGAATNSATLNGFDAPTMRGMTDRFLQFSLGITNADDVQVLARVGVNIPPTFVAAPSPVPWDPVKGMDEATTFATAFLAFTQVYGMGPLDSFQMFEEASTGFSGAQARQLTLHSSSAGTPLTSALMTALETADLRGVVNLRAEGLRAGAPISLSFRDTGVYQGGALQLTPAQLRSEAQSGNLLVTLTAELRQNVGKSDFPQALISTATVGNGTTGDPPLPVIPTSGSSNPNPFNVKGVDVRQGAKVFVDGVPASGATISCVSGSFTPFCSSQTVSVDLTAKPPAGLHVLQLQNDAGPLSNELPFCVGTKTQCK